VLFTYFLLCFESCCGHVIQNEALEKSREFSPYYAAFSDKLKSEIKEYERLKKQLKQFHEIDWDVIADVKAFESSSD
jgi:hypothetical protein